MDPGQKGRLAHPCDLIYRLSKSAFNRAIRAAFCGSLQSYRIGHGLVKGSITIFLRRSFPELRAHGATTRLCPQTLKRQPLRGIGILAKCARKCNPCTHHQRTSQIALFRCLFGSVAIATTGGASRRLHLPKKSTLRNRPDGERARAAHALASKTGREFRLEPAPRRSFDITNNIPSAPCRNRTYNLVIKSHLLCQLS